MTVTNKKGFTLTEILIVISILVFLALLILAITRGQVFKGNDARRKGDIRRISVAVEEYEKDNNCYPLPQLVVCEPGDGLLPYIEKIPCDPVTKASYFYEPEGSTCPGWYRIYTNLNNKSDEEIANQGCQYGCGPQTAYNFYASSPNAPTPDQGSSGSGGSGGAGGGGGGEVSDFYGCRSLACVPISWDPARPGPECDPNYGNPTCYGFCSNPNNECQAWNQ